MKLTDGVLILATMAGIVMALGGLLDGAARPPGPGTAAVVNEAVISTEELESRLAARAREGAGVGQLLDTLDDLIDEELLIQRAAELDLLRRDSVVRFAIVDAMERSILSEVRGSSPTEQELVRFYGENAELFREPRAFQLEEIVVRPGGPAGVFEEALLQGVSAESLAADSDVVDLARLPPVPLSLATLSRRLPEEALASLAMAAMGDVLRYETNRGTHLVKVRGLRESWLPSFDAVRSSVLNELELQREDRAYEAYLDSLRDRADVRRNESLAP